MDDPVIKLNTRGQMIEVRKSILLNMRYFNCLLGEGPFKGSEPHADGSYYIDIDRDVFRELLSYVEFGGFRTNRFNGKYLLSVMDKFGIIYEVTKKESSAEKADRIRKEFQDEFLQQIETHLVDNNIHIELVTGDKDEFKYLDEKLIVVYTMFHYKFIRSILKSQSLATEFFNKIPQRSVLYLNIENRLNRQMININFAAPDPQTDNTN